MAATFFALANLVSGVLHYLFQVIASKQMSAADFADFSVWYALMAVLSAFGAFFQYGGNFAPTTSKQVLGTLLAAISFNLFLCWFWFALPEGSSWMQIALIALAAAAFGWMLGQVQQRMLFTIMGVLHLSLAISKLVFIAFPLPWGTVLDRYQFSILFSYLPPLLILFLVTRNPKWSLGSAPGRAAEMGRWAVIVAPLVLSIAGSMIPQLDLLLLQRWIAGDEFQTFARASLFYKGIYFLMFIFAQWALPQQISGSGGKAQKVILTWWFPVGAVVGSGLVTLAAPVVEMLVLKWDVLPPAWMIYWSCLNMGLMTWIFLLMQEACAQQELKWAFGILGGLLSLAGLQVLLERPLFEYFLLACVGHSLLVVLLFRRIQGVRSGTPSH